MDEPFAALDYFTRLAMEEEIVRIHQKYHMGIIFVTHDVSEALLIGQNLFVFNKNAPPEQFQIDEDYPRNIDTPEMIALKEKLLIKLKPQAF